LSTKTNHGDLVLGETAESSLLEKLQEHIDDKGEDDNGFGMPNLWMYRGPKAIALLLRVPLGGRRGEQLRLYKLFPLD